MKLTQRRAEVLRHLAAGRSNKEIAEGLKISEQAVKDHVSGLFKQFGVANRASLVRAGLALQITGSATFEEHWLRYLFVDAPMQIAVMRGPDHVVEVVNPLLRETANTDPVGRPARTVLRDVLGRRILDLLDHVYETGERIALHELPVEWSRGGTQTTGHADLVLEPRRDERGQTDGIFMLVHDVTSAVRARSRADLALTRDSAILARTTLGVLIVDQEYRPLLVNDAAEQVMGGTLEATRPLDPQLMAHWKFLDEAGQPLPREHRPLVRALRGETVARTTVVAQRDGWSEPMSLEVSAAPLLDADGHVRAAIATFGERRESQAHPALLELTERVAQALRRLREVAVSTGMAFDRVAIANIVANMVRWLIQADAAAIFVASERTGTLRLLADDNLSTRPRITEIPIGVGVSGVAYARGIPVRVSAYASWPHALPELLPVIRSAMAVPLLRATIPFGVIAVHTVAERTFADEEEWALVRIASEAAALVDPAGAPPG